MFTHLSIDWGEKRCGMAFGDISTGLILPFTKELETRDVLQILSQELVSRKISEIVVGIPTNFAGKDTKITGSIQKFIKLINSTLPNITVHTINERSTTLDAKKLLGKNPTKHHVNHQSAGGILELYFQKVKPLNRL